MPKPSTSIKKEARALIERLPAKASWNDLMYEIYVHQKIARALKAAKKGPWFSTDQVRRSILKK